jgi:hypothetical protein
MLSNSPELYPQSILEGSGPWRTTVICLANVKDIKKRNLPNEPVPDEHGMKDP